MNLQDAIALARKVARDGDVEFGVFILRDRPEIEAAGLKDLVCAMYRGAYCVESELEWLIEQVLAHAERLP